MHEDRNRIRDYILETTPISENQTIIRLLVKGLIIGIFVIILLYGLLLLSGVLTVHANAFTRIAFFIANILIIVNSIYSWDVAKRKASIWKNQKNKTKEASGETHKIILGGSIGFSIIMAQQITRSASQLAITILIFTIIFILLMIVVHLYVIEIYKLYLLQKYCPELKNQTNSKPLRK